MAPLVAEMPGRFVAIFTSAGVPDCLTGPAKAMAGDTSVVAGQLVTLHCIEAPELDQTFPRPTGSVRHDVFGRP
jgi:hypothetical protein